MLLHLYQKTSAHPRTALITTQMGLIVAIPAVLLGNTLKGQADAVVARLERSALRVVNLLA